MRGEVVAALLHSPQAALLDEPTIGLECVSKEAAAGVPAPSERAERGTTLLLTTHDLADIERLCDDACGRPRPVVHAGDLAGWATESALKRVLVATSTCQRRP